MIHPPVLSWVGAALSYIGGFAGLWAFISLLRANKVRRSVIAAGVIYFSAVIVVASVLLGLVITRGR